MLNYVSSFKDILLHPFNRSRVLSTVIRLIVWKIFQKAFGQDVIVELENSTKMLIPAKSSYGSIIQYTRGCPDLIETQILLKVLKKDDVFIDVGANIGYYSILALGQGATTYSFEPNEALHFYISYSAELNADEKKLHLSSKIVSDHQGYEHFVFEKESEISHIGQLGVHKKAKKLECTSLDSVATLHNLKSIKLVKIDVEGAEPVVFKGMKKLFTQKKISYLLFEHDPMNNGNKEYIDFIHELSNNKYLFSIEKFGVHPFKMNDLNKKRNLFVNFNRKDLNLQEPCS